MDKQQVMSGDAASLRRRAEIQLRDQQPKTVGDRTDADTRRLFHELQVHQIELELQNAELLKARDELEAALQKSTDLYDFAPVGYLSLDEQGQILELNLTAATLLGVERSQLINRRLPAFVVPASLSVFLAFLKKMFSKAGDQTCETLLLKRGGGTFWASCRGTSAVCVAGERKWCRVTFSDITERKQAESVQRRMAVLTTSNLKLQREIVRRQKVEESLKKSERQQSLLLGQSRQMQAQLRYLSRQVLQAQEEERKRISRELHDVIAQTLTGINVQLSALAREAGINPKDFDRNIARTQRLVEKSVDIVHQFARELRPAVLDDLGLVPALHTFMKNFTAQTGVRTHLTAFAGVEHLDMARRTVLFRVAQEALTNVARHARASSVEVSLQKLADCICMKIKDDGKSFQAQRQMQAKGGKRLGLLGMRERLEMIGGRFEVESAPGEGTTVRAQISLGNAGGKRKGDQSNSRKQTLKL